MEFFSKRDIDNNYKAINWNQVNDMLDKMTWEKLVEQFWTDTRIPISNDKDDWRKLTEAEKTMIGRVFGGLTLLDTLQSQDGVSVLKGDVLTQHEEAVLNNISFMECLTADSKVLVKNKGWVSVKDVVEGDFILQYNSEKKMNEFGRVLETSSHTPEKLYGIHNEDKKIDIKMSKGHRIVFRNLDTDTDEVMTAEEFFKLDPSERTKFAFMNKVDFTSEGIEKDESDIRTLKLVTIKGLISRKTIKVKKIDEGIELHYKGNDIYSYKEFREIMTLKGWKIKSDSVKNSVKATVTDSRDIVFIKSPIHEVLELERLGKMELIDIAESLSGWVREVENPKINNNFKREEKFFQSSNKSELIFFETLMIILNAKYRKEGNKIYLEKLTTHTDKYLLANGLDYTIYDNKDKEKVYGIRVPSTFIYVKTGLGETMVTGNSMHAKSYSSIFSTLNTPAEIDEIFEWTNNNQYIQFKAKAISEIYENGSALQKKAASVMLESFLFYSGFYAPLYYLGINKMPNVAEVIRLIIRDESVHGTYIGAKFRIVYNQLPENEQDQIKAWVYEKVYELYANEEIYTQMLYDELGWTNDVLTFVRYNANKALQNLGFDSLFSDTAEDVNPIVMNGLSTGTANHDFFSQVGNGYRVAPIESMSTEDYDY